jgi:hypothetical protein
VGCGDKSGVIVVGMSRAGTSAVTRTFVSAGFFAGNDEDLLGASEANPTGHWENLNTWRVNEEILRRLGGSWFDPPSEEVQIDARAWAAPQLLRVLEQIVDDAGNAPVALKDPRFGVMLPLWGEIIDHHLHPVLVIRDPIEIALSLQRRDGTPTSFTLAAWQLHMTAVLRHMHQRLVTVACYPQLVGSAQHAQLIVGATASHLRDDLAGRVTGHALITPDPALHRNRVSVGDHEQQMSVRQLELWTALASLESGDQRIELPEHLLECGPAVLDTLHAETERQSATERLFVAEQSWAAERERNDTLSIEQAADRARCDALTLEVADLSTQLEAAKANRHRAEHSLQSIQRSASWRVTAPLRACKRSVRQLPRSDR